MNVRHVREPCGGGEHHRADHPEGGGLADAEDRDDAAPKGRIARVVPFGYHRAGRALRIPSRADQAPAVRTISKSAQEMSSSWNNATSTT